MSEVNVSLKNSIEHYHYHLYIRQDDLKRSGCFMILLKLMSMSQIIIHHNMNKIRNLYYQVPRIYIKVLGYPRKKMTILSIQYVPFFYNLKFGKLM
jgi:hypothetical protein